MDIDANDDMEMMHQSMEESTTGEAGGSKRGESGINSLMEELISSIPGIDEAMSFAEPMKQLQVLD